jgi:hypothetical protein
MGLRPTQGDEKRLLSEATLPWKRRPHLCHLDRSEAQWRDLCVDAPSWKCFSTEESWACGPTKAMKNVLCPATAFHGSVALPFVIPSEAEGSAVPRTSLGNVFRPSVAQWRDLRFSSGGPVECSVGIRLRDRFPPQKIQPQPPFRLAGQECYPSN